MLKKIEASELKETDMIFINNSFHTVMQIENLSSSIQGDTTEVTYSYHEIKVMFSRYANLLVWRV